MSTMQYIHLMSVLAATLALHFSISSAAFVPSSRSRLTSPSSARATGHEDVKQSIHTNAALSRSEYRPIRLASALNLSSEGSGGDQLRASTGIRPSLHPTTINAISEALLLRHSAKNAKPIDLYKEEAQPLEVAVTAGSVASDLLEKRKTSCEADGDVGSIPTPEECQTVAGRVVGVVMRMRELEMDLATKVNGVAWVNKYGEHGSFGVLKSECKKVAAAAEEGDKGDADAATATEIEIDPKIERELTDKIRDDPLFRMCRAECLLAVFLQKVEVPKLLEIGETVPGGSLVDFIDEDRRNVILS